MNNCINRLGIIIFLDSMQMEYSITEHPPAETIEVIDSFQLPHANAIVKNLFLRDDKKREYFLIMVCKDKTVNLKALRNTLGSRPLSFASESDLILYLGTKKGSVTPFGILNDNERAVRVVFDEDLLSFPVIGVHPNENTATLWISPADLHTLMKNHGNSVVSIKI